MTESGAPTAAHAIDRDQDWSEVLMAARAALKAEREGAALVCLRETGSELPLFFVAGLQGLVTHFQRYLPFIGDERPLYALQPVGRSGANAPDARLVAMAARNIREIRRVQPHGPYLLSGYCAGGSVAFEMAQQLVAGGESIGLLAMLDSWNPQHAKRRIRLRAVIHQVQRRASAGDKLAYLRARAGDRMWSGVPKRLRHSTSRRALVARAEPRLDVAASYRLAFKTYKPQPYAGSVVLLRGVDPRLRARLGVRRDLGWGFVAGAGVVVHEFAGVHRDFQAGPMIQAVGETLRELMADTARR